MPSLASFNLHVLKFFGEKKSLIKPNQKRNREENPLRFPPPKKKKTSCFKNRLKTLVCYHKCCKIAFRINLDFKIRLPYKMIISCYDTHTITNHQNKNIVIKLNIIEKRN